MQVRTKLRLHSCPVWDTNDSLISLYIPIKCFPVGNGILFDHPFDDIKFSLNINDCCMDNALPLGHSHLEDIFTKNPHSIAIRQQDILGRSFCQSSDCCATHTSLRGGSL